MRKAMQAETASKLIFEEKTDKFNLPARLMRIQSEQDPATPHYGIVLTVAKARFVYKIIYVTPNESTLDTEMVQHYFNSLKWLPSFY